MSNSIRTYEELLAEEKRLAAVLELKKEKLRSSINSFGEELKPAVEMFSIFRDLTVQNKENLVLNAGINLLIDKVVQKGILSKAGWISRLIIPFFLKNYSSNFISRWKDSWLEKLEVWLGSKNGTDKVEKSKLP